MPAESRLAAWAQSSMIQMDDFSPTFAVLLISTSDVVFLLGSSSVFSCKGILEESKDPKHIWLPRLLGQDACLFPMLPNYYIYAGLASSHLFSQGNQTSINLSYLA